MSTFPETSATHRPPVPETLATSRVRGVIEEGRAMSPKQAARNLLARLPRLRQRASGGFVDTGKL